MPLSASAQKESQKEHAEKTKVSAAMASVQQIALCGGTSAGSVHAPPVEAVQATTSIEKGGPPRPPPTNNTAQQAAPQHATVHPSVAIGPPVVPAPQLNPPPPPRPSGQAITEDNPRQPAQQQAEESSAVGEGPPVEPSPHQDKPEDVWSADYDTECGDGTSNQVELLLSL